MQTRNRLSILLAMFIIALTTACNHRDAADYQLHYTVSPDTAGHYLNVCLTYQTDSTQPHGSEVVLTMPRWAPGYYEMLDFAKHLTDFSAKDTQGQALAWTKEGLNRWRVALPENGRLEVSYRVYANLRDVASSRVERDVAFVAPNGVFMYVAGEQTHPVTVRFVLPDGWQHIATGMKPHADDSCTFTAPDFDVLYDSPLLMGNFYTKRFAHEGHDYEFALETPDGAEEMQLEENFKRIVTAATQLMGDVPYDNYCLIHMGEGQGGLEHLNSQACYTDGTYRFATRREEVKFLGFIAHEYFHLYNVKCIRPAELWPLDYDHEAFTPMLWVSEGLTCYYEFRLLRYAGIITPDEALELLSTYFALYAPYEGQRHQSLRQSSYDIWLNFMNPDDNARDVRINYYFKGPVIGLLLDIDIRRKTQQQKSLDDVMRLLYRRYYHELQRGFTEEEFWSACAEVVGQPLSEVSGQPLSKVARQPLTEEPRQPLTEEPRQPLTEEPRQPLSKVARQPLAEVRHFVDTTDDIPYADYLSDAGLRIDTTSWAILPVNNPTPAQLQFLRAMNLAE